MRLKTYGNLWKIWVSLIYDSSVHYFEPLDDVDILDSSQISFTFKYDYDLIENE